LPGSLDTRDRILSAAVNVLQKETLAGASIDRVIEAAGVARKTFYLHFKSKDDLFAAIVEDQRPKYIERFKYFAESVDADSSPVDRIKAVVARIGLAAKSPEWKGCCFMRLAAEVSHYPGHPIRKMVAQANSDLSKWIETNMIPRNFGSPSVIAERITLVLNGMIMLQMISRSDEPVNNALSMIDMLMTERRDLAQAA
jgi:AcrR family transcriptional regulator